MARVHAPLKKRSRTEWTDGKESTLLELCEQFKNSPGETHLSHHGKGITGSSGQSLLRIEQLQ